MENRQNGYIDWINLVLATILLVTPWIFGASGSPFSFHCAPCT